MWRVPAAGPRAGTRVGATYSIPLTGVDVQDECQSLTLHSKNTFGMPPPPFEAFSVDVEERRLHVPRFYGLQRFGAAETDERTWGREASSSLTFAGTLTPVQQEAARVLFDGHLSSTGVGGAIVVLPCGFGKTVWGVYAACRLGRKTCVLVHKGVIRDQWLATFATFCPGVKVGVLQGGKEWPSSDCDVVLAMVMTVAKRDVDASVFDDVGFVLVDEAHHMAAPVMNLALRVFRARFVCGLTATKERPDGLTPLLHWCLGPQGFFAEREGGESVRVSVALFSGGTPEIVRRDGKPLMSAMITALARHAGRNAFLADRIASLRAGGRVLLVLSDRLEQLRALRELLLARGLPEEELGLFVGSTKEAARAEQLSRAVVMCSYQMANEGVDKREADTCVMATPKGRVVQCIGRIQRPCATKQSPLVLDVADEVSVFVPLRYKRQALYRKEQYTVQVKRVSDADPASWFA